MAQSAFAEQQTETSEQTSTATENPVSTEANTESPNPEDSASDNSDKVNITEPISKQAQYLTDIEKSIDKSLITPVLIGTEEVLTITEPDSHSSDKGVVILLPDWQQNATSPKAINFLRQHLPTEGWTTITIQPLPKPASYPSQNEKTELANEENQQTLKEYQQELVKVVDAVMQKAVEYPGVFLLITEGSNGAILLDAYQQELVMQPNAIVLLSAYLPSVEGNNLLASNVATSELPILDLYLSKDNHWLSHIMTPRLRAAKKEMKIYYRQRKLTTFNVGYYPEDELAVTIKGWLASIGW